jgi:hypothetical protein
LISEKLQSFESETDISTVISGCSGRFKIVVTNIGMQPSAQFPTGPSEQYVGRLIMVVSVDQEIVFAHTINRMGQHFEINGARTAKEVEIPFEFIPDQTKCIQVKLFKAHILSEDMQESIWNPNSTNLLYADEESVDGTLVRSFGFGIDTEAPVLSFSIYHLASEPNALEDLQTSNTLSTAKLFNFVDTQKYKSANALQEDGDTQRLKYVNILTEKRSLTKHKAVPSSKLASLIQKKRLKVQILKDQSKDVELSDCSVPVLPEDDEITFEVLHQVFQKLKLRGITNSEVIAKLTE